MKKKTKRKQLKNIKKSHKKTAKKKKSLMKKLMGRLLKKKNKKVAKKVKTSKKTAKKMPVKKKTVKKLKKSPGKARKVLKKVPKIRKATPERKVKKMKVVPQTVPVAVAPVQVPVPQASAFTHEPVLMDEVLQQLDLPEKMTVVDGTLGLGGHAGKMLETMHPDGQLIGFDVDDDNMAVAKENLKAFGPRAVFVRSNFSNLQEELKKLKIRSVEAILLDLGLSSPQVDNPEKGFSFMREGALDMRFDKTQPLTAADVINTYSGNELMRIFFEYGEERFARKIATEIVRRRKARSFKTTTELAHFIEKLIGRKGHIHPATRVFQALRIEVNHELDVLMSTLKQAVEVLKKHGRLAVISYHSLEDRAVKQFFKECAREFVNEPDKLTTTHLKPTLKIITKKPIVPSDAEISKNPRSRSAKLRVAEKI
jgi:16S rRNA (cytosine1402-N4)-methyltransferase